MVGRHLRRQVDEIVDLALGRKKPQLLLRNGIEIRHAVHIIDVADDALVRLHGLLVLQSLHALVELETLPQGSRGGLCNLEALAKSAITLVRIEALESAVQVVLGVVAHGDVRAERGSICNRTVGTDLPQQRQVDGGLAVTVHRGLEHVAIVERVGPDLEHPVARNRRIGGGDDTPFVSKVRTLELVGELLEA